MINRILHTDRLLIRPLEESDLDLIIEMNTDPVVMKYVPPLQTIDEVKQSMPVWLSLGLEVPYKGIWIMVEKATGTSFGTLAIVDLPYSDPEIDPVEYTGNMEIGYRSIPSYWGKGFTTEGARALIGFAFENSDLKLIAACTHNDNTPSQNILKKVGLTHLGKRWVYGGDDPYFEITRADWLVDNGG